MLWLLGTRILRICAIPKPKRDERQQRSHTSRVKKELRTTTHPITELALQSNGVFATIDQEVCYSFGSDANYTTSPICIVHVRVIGVIAHGCIVVRFLTHVECPFHGFSRVLLLKQTRLARIAVQMRFSPVIGCYSHLRRPGFALVTPSDVLPQRLSH